MNEYSITAEQLTKIYRLYNSPLERLKESFHPFRKQYHKPFYALKNINLYIHTGETFGLIGKNGSGKSTLLKILTGTLTPSSGQLQVCGRVASLLELGAGFNPEMTGIENIYFSGTIMGFTRKQMEAKVEAIVDFADIGDFIHQPAKFYSSGMYARLAFAVNIAVDPDVLIVDEALSVGDAGFVHRCMLRFHEMQKMGKTILLVTHDATMIKELCHRALWLDKGQTRMEGDAHSIADAYARFIHDIAEAPTGPSDKKLATPPTHSGPKCVHETTIPPNDGRSGSQDIAILGVGLYDDHERPCSTFQHHEWATLRLTVRNGLDTTCSVTVGYLIRTRKGVDWASSSSNSIGVDVGELAPGEVGTYAIRIHIPILYPESYSISPSVGYLDTNGEARCTDRIENALLFDVPPSKTQMYIQMQFDTQYARLT